MTAVMNPPDVPSDYDTDVRNRVQSEFDHEKGSKWNSKDDQHS
jgi:hypothetical protein